ncbi:uncharacterized protein EI97DRAFT_432447 [Westerdykella ornata]|uniref:Mus7/MMS22 family-domain-containing protein n=1 Tax=Westerdykella ornata TaxID=318751 RepID=A0A6A6JLX0_WESOR|nr:uncharacterized protein EI97DRAFT_432447 [Westerdykella ornata]KAF2277591.1 hypothetical protein EI97DRAFT_432447 [Westerdykella ornata]
MSGWRLKGFVQDSDEEDDGLDSLSTNSSSPTPQSISDTHVFPKPQAASSSQRSRCSQDAIESPEKPYGTLVNPEKHAEKVEQPLVASPFTTPAHQRKPTESPDPLQGSPTPKPAPVTQLASNALISDRSGVVDTYPRLSVSESDEDDLSDSPSDVDTPHPILTSPQRRPEVQVVIPQPSTAWLLSTTERVGRSLRARKPIQLHPYLLEGEMYRRECQKRGIKPVPRPKSPARRARHEEDESQEQDFDPVYQSPLNSPPPRLLSTPIRGDRGGVRRHAHSAGRPRSGGKRQAHGPHNAPWSQPDVPSANGRKRRKLDAAFSMSPGPSGGEVNTRDRPTANGIAQEHVDVWGIPDSPPESSSPGGGNRTSPDPELRKPPRIGIVHVRSLPTPSDSPDMQEEDPGAGAPNTRRAGRFRPIVVSSEDSSTDSSISSPDSESEAEAQVIKKKIRGVLPASWIRFDQQRQRKKKQIARSQSNHGSIPEREELQRGVAQRILRPAALPPRASAPADPEVIEILDASDDGDDRVLPGNPNDVQKAAREAAELAAQYDRRYDIDDDLASMENDRLPLYSLGGTASGRKRRHRQLKLTDAFPASKRQRVLNDELRIPAGLGSRRGDDAFRRTQQKTTRTRKTSRDPPALSIIDVAESTAGTNPIPQFMKIAMRRVRQRADQGRQSPTNKHIRLSTAQDTEDACSILRQWTNGEIRRRPNARAQTGEHPPSTVRKPHEKEMRFPRTPIAAIAPSGAPPPIGMDLIALRRKEEALEDGSILASTARTQLPKKHSNTPLILPAKGNHRSVVRRQAPNFRTAQLEGLESEYGKGSSNIQFQRGLRRADLSYMPAATRWVPSINPQLARFLAQDETALLSPLPNEDVSKAKLAEAIDKDVSAKRTQHRRLRKKRAQRVDVEAREYRQPSQPTPMDLIDNEPAAHDTTADHAGLEGLGPYGTVYPTSFDISPLPIGTYFHSETFIGQEELKRALLVSQRDMDTFPGHHIFQVGSEHVRCGPWTDETWTRIASSFDSSWSASDPSRLAAMSSTLRSLIKYINTNLSFLDAIDRRDFVLRMKNLLSSQSERILSIDCTCDDPARPVATKNEIVRPLGYILVISLQLFLVAQHVVVESSIRDLMAAFISSSAKTIIQHIIRRGIPDLGIFLERNRSLLGRESGIQDKDILVESVVICMVTLRHAGIPGSGFWDLVSQELSSLIKNTKHVKKLDSVWATVFTLLPFVEIDASGVLITKHRFELANENWAFVKDILQQVFSLYPASKAEMSSSLNEYVRANLRRCHELIKTWHWVKCDPMLTTVLGFFAKRHYRPLSGEEDRGSPTFLQDLGEEPQLSLMPCDSAFHIFLKSVALGVNGMRNVYAEKIVRSFVSRCIPNHDRTYPKEKSLGQDSLNALRNNHDLLCTLYRASPPSCRPKVTLLRRLVDHEGSHREACRLNVRAWENLTLFQLSTGEPYEVMQPFAEWHKEIMEQTLKQYRLAKTEADEFLKIKDHDGSADVDARMVQLTMGRNQKQAIATLRDCVAGIHRAVQKNPGVMFMKDFLIDSGVVQLLELIHVDDQRLSIVIRKTLAMLRVFISSQNKQDPRLESQSNNEESQDYGDFPDIEDLEDIAQEMKEHPVLDWIQSPLWHLLSNAFGTESMPDDNLLMECVDTWVQLAVCQVSMGLRSWSHYVGPFSPVSWQQLRDTEQSRKFRPYFMATLLRTKSAAYKEHRSDFMGTLLVSLVEREALLRFQYRLLHVLVQSSQEEPLLKNIPFYRDNRTGEFDITADTLKQRRLSLLSSILANMQDDIYRAKLEEPYRVAELKREYASLLDSMMLAMKNNYLQLGQRSTVAGAYVEFVQKIVHFLKQYSSDICTVNAFFTDSIAFPLPATDPHYVVGRLCGYAPKLQNPGIAKQLVTFVHTVAQQAAKDNHGEYLVRQLSTALTNEEDPSLSISPLRSLFLQDIVPAYIEVAFSSVTGFLIAKPVLQSLRTILKVLPFELRVNDDASVETVFKNISSISYAFIRSIETLNQTPPLLSKPHVMHAISLMLDALAAAIPTLEYIIARALGEQRKHPIVIYCTKFVASIKSAMTDSHSNSELPPTTAFPVSDVLRHQPSDVLTFCNRNLQDALKAHWTEMGSGAIFFGHGHARKEVVVDVGSEEEEMWRLERAGREFCDVVRWVYGDDEQDAGDRVGEGGRYALCTAEG